MMDALPFDATLELHQQKTPANAVEIMKLLLEAGTEPDALADMSDQKCTTMSMLVSSSHPYDAGEDPDRFNLEGFHSHALPLQSICKSRQ